MTIVAKVAFAVSRGPKRRNGHLFVPNDKLAYIRNGNVLEKCPGNGVNTTDDALFDPRPLKIGILGQFGPFSSPKAALGASQWPSVNSYNYTAYLRPSIKHDNVPKTVTT